MKGWVGWLIADGLPTLVVTHAGRAQDRESSPARDRRSTTVPCHQLHMLQTEYCGMPFAEYLLSSWCHFVCYCLWLQSGCSSCLCANTWAWGHCPHSSREWFVYSLVSYVTQHPTCKKTEWWSAGMVICLERGTDLHTAQLMPLPLTVFCFSKIHIGFTFLVPAHPGSPGQRAIKRVYVCMWHTA